VSKAEVIEIADNVFDHRDGTTNSKPQARKGCSDNSDNNNKRKLPESALRSVTYSNRGREINGNHDRNHGGGRHTHAANKLGQSLAQAAQPFEKRNGNSASKPTKETWKGSSQKKSVKFADLSEKEMAQIRAVGAELEGKCSLVGRYMCRTFVPQLSQKEYNVPKWKQQAP
jgi:hypothetical protein